MRALLAVAVLGLTSNAAAQQVNVAAPERLKVTTTSEEASRHFFEGLSAGRNIFFSRATMHLDRAIASDASLGIAKVFRAAFAPGMTQAERTTEISRVIATMGGATTPELIVALAVRDFPNNEQSHAQWETAAKLLPGDPNIAFYAALTAPAAGNVAAMRSVTERFPDDAPSFNILAYRLWQSGDKEAGFKAVRRYVELAPNEPNAHDSYAELLQWSDRFSDALTHYGRSVQLDSSFAEGYMGLAEVNQLTGRGVDARRWIQLAIAHAPGKAEAVGYTRALARSYLMDGMLKEAMDQFAIALKDAQTLNRPKLVADIHRDMAFFDAQLGKGTAVASHTSAAATAEGSETPDQITMLAASNAVGGDLATARQAAQKLSTLAQTNSDYATKAHVVNAIIAIRDKKCTEAMAELSGSPLDDPWVRTLTAECAGITGNLADARALKNAVVTDPQLNLDDGYNVAARIRAAKIKA